MEKPRTSKAIHAAAALAVGCALLCASQASAAVRIVAPLRAVAAHPVRFAARPTAPTQAIAFYIDGRRRWVDRSPRWVFGRDGYVRLPAGHHVLKVRARQGETIVTTRRQLDVKRGADDEAATPPTQTPSVSENRPVAAPERPAAASGSSPAVMEDNCENGLQGWSTAGVGEVIPTPLAAGTPDSPCRVALSGSQNRSELIFADREGEPIEFEEGDEGWYDFSFNIQQMVYGHPGAHNLIMQFKSEGEGSPNFALGLWDYAGDDGQSGGKGLWTEGEATGGNRFLAPLSEREWHNVAIHFKASSQGAGFYEVFLDGTLVDSRSGVSMIVPGHATAYIKNGIYRNGVTNPGFSELLLGPARLGASAAEVEPS